MPEVNSVVAVCDNRSQATKTMKELEKAGFDMAKVSLVGDAKTGKVFVICDGPFSHRMKDTTSRRAHGKGTKIPTAA